MIRRPFHTESGAAGRVDNTDAWMLISQVEHARLSGALAAAWSDAISPLPSPRDEMVAAVARHDDGWLAWELRPTVLEGRPREFLEMPFDEALAIWRRSIAVAQMVGPLAGYAVSGHFSILAQAAKDREPRSFAWLDLADEFLEEQTDLQAQWLTNCQARHGVEAGTDETRRAVDLLRFFDFASLWFCRAPRTEAETIGIGREASITFGPQGKPESAAGAVVTLAPWPLLGDRLEVGVTGRVVPAVDYTSADALAKAPSTDVRLVWTLLPA
jgi:hypothetical protein